MTNYRIVENKAASVKKYLKICSTLKKYSRSEIEKNPLVRGAVERYLFLASQATIDLADSYIALKKLRKPTTIAESFQILEEEKLIGPSLTEKMIAMGGFRNIMSHDYDKLDYDIVYDVLQNRLKDIDMFLKKIK